MASDERNRECPLCGAKNVLIASHVWWVHLPGTTCWCGRTFDADAEGYNEWKAHVDAHGGFLAHWMARQLEGKADA